MEKKEKTGVFEKIRRWIDAEDRDELQAIFKTDEQIDKADQFLSFILREIDKTMNSNKWINHADGEVYLPVQFIVFLNAKDDREWKGPRRALQKTLSSIINKRIIELFGSLQIIVGKNENESQNQKPDYVTVQLRVDGTLPENQVTVAPVWDDSIAEKTPLFSQPVPLPAETQIVELINPYYLITKQKGKRQEKHLIDKRIIKIGRGGEKIPVDVCLSGDQTISKLHATLIVDEKQKIRLTAHGANTTLVNGKKIENQSPVLITPKKEIWIGTYTLRIQPTKPRRLMIKKSKKPVEQAKTNKD